MAVSAFVATIWTDPVEAVKLLFYGVQELSARDDGVRGLADFGARVYVVVDVTLFLVLNRHVVRVFALLAFFANASFEVSAKSFLVVYGTPIFSHLNLSDTLKERRNKRLLLLRFLSILFLRILGLKHLVLSTLLANTSMKTRVWSDLPTCYRPP